PRGTYAAHVDVVLDGERYAVERAQRGALAPACLARPRGRTRTVAVERDDRIEHGVHLRDAREQRFHDRNRREAARRVTSREVGRRKPPKITCDLRHHIFDGSHVANEGSAIKRNVNRIMITAYGSAPQIASSMPPLSGRMPCTTNRFMPTGGVIIPSSHMSTM